MKSIEIKVPRNLIRKFYTHPEPYGDGYYVVDLINGMYTDVFYREEGEFVTITNDNKLISYLKNNQLKSRDYFFRNGVYSLRIKGDIGYQNIDDWKSTTPILVELEMPQEHKLPSEFMFCFYWIEVGYATIEDRTMTLRVYEKNLIHMIDIGVAIDLIIESIEKQRQLLFTALLSRFFIGMLKTVKGAKIYDGVRNCIKIGHATHISMK